MNRQSRVLVNTFRDASAGLGLKKTLVLTLCGLAAACVAVAQAPVGSWQVTFKITGTIQGLNEQLAINSGGHVIAGNGTGSDVAGHASPELMAKIEAWLKTAQPAKADIPPIPDALLLSAVVSRGDHVDARAVPADLYPALQAVFNSVIKQALLGVWRQSGWKLCHPAEQLPASEYDPPVDRLTFQPDGTFTVTWRGGGAHTTGIPHGFVPDYHGRYEAFAESGYVALKYEGGIVNPRDFSGNGHFAITAEQLVLRDIWLGTRQVPKKPDICELTFTREAKTQTLATH
jgi:hypothetical protein